MIIVHRLNGQTFGVSADHIERIEEMPDTVITLLDGKKLLVQESMQEVIDRVIDFRATILRISYVPRAQAQAQEPSLRLITDPEVDADRGHS